MKDYSKTLACKDPVTHIFSTIQKFKFHDLLECSNCGFEKLVRIKDCCRDPFFEIRYQHDNYGNSIYYSQCVTCGYANKSKAVTRKNNQANRRFDEEMFKGRKILIKEENDIEYQLVKERNIFNSNNTKYQLYLESPEWKEKAKRVMERDNYLCKHEDCQNKAQEVHHLTYERVFNENLDDLLSVCSNCHKKIHDKK